MGPACRGCRGLKGRARVAFSARQPILFTVLGSPKGARRGAQTRKTRLFLAVRAMAGTVVSRTPPPSGASESVKSLLEPCR